MNDQLFSKKINRGAIALIATATALTGATVVYSTSNFGQTAQTTSIPSAQPPAIARKITALARLEPQTEIVKLGVAATLRDDVVSKLLVKEGDKIEAGQIIAILDSYDRFSVALEEAKQKVQVAQARLDQIKAGAKVGEIVAQTATVGRLEAQLEGDKQAKIAEIGRLEAQLEGDKQVQIAAIARLEAQWQGEQKAQIATINKLEAELKNAQSEFNRYQQLYAEGAISNSIFDTKRLATETARQELNEAKVVLKRIQETGIKQLVELKTTLKRIEETGAKQLSEARTTLQKIEETGVKQVGEATATLNKIAEVRPVDVQVAQTEVNSAMTAVKRAEAELKLTQVRSPLSGQILKIHTRPGETISNSGIAEIGQTSEMVAVAEVYQTDINHIKIGQKATITSQAFPKQLHGIVSQIGLQVTRQNVFSNQPGENLDRRVIEVKIRLNSEASKQVAGLTNLQVQVAIEI